MVLKKDATLLVFLVRVNGALEEIFTNLSQAEAYMRAHRKNGQFWRITEKRTMPHIA